MNIIILSLILFLVTGVPLVQAHEKRVVAGQFDLIVGFVNEPAFSGEMNGVDLRIAKSVTAEAVEGAEKTLTVKVTAEGKEILLPLRERYKDPGHYAAYFLPSRPGKYVFVFEGKINGVVIKEQFESGGKFHDVEDSQAVRFP